MSMQSPESTASTIVDALEGTQMACDARRPWENPNTLYVPSAGYLWQRIVDVLSGKPMKEWRLNELPRRGVEPPRTGTVDRVEDVLAHAGCDPSRADTSELRKIADAPIVDMDDSTLVSIRRGDVLGDGKVVPLGDLRRAWTERSSAPGMLIGGEVVTLDAEGFHRGEPEDPDALKRAALKWWELHQFDAGGGGDDIERNVYDEPPEFVKVALGMKSTDIPDPALSMAHACACAVCEMCASGSYELLPPAGERKPGYRHVVPAGRSDSEAGGFTSTKEVPCKASAIHRLIGTKVT